MRVYGSLWSLWVLIGPYAFLLVFMGPCRSLSVLMGPYWFLSVLMGPYGCFFSSSRLDLGQQASTALYFSTSTFSF